MFIKPSLFHPRALSLKVEQAEFKVSDLSGLTCPRMREFNFILSIYIEIH